MKKVTKPHRDWRHWLGMLCAGLAPPLAAQQTSEEAQQDVSVLKPVIVTASRLTQSVEELPVAVTVLTEQQVRPGALTPMTEVAQQVPGLNFMDYGRLGESYISMRGISTLGAALNSLDSAVGLSLDGVPTSLSAFGAPLLDVQQIEVLAGPQGTSFGRNAFAGGINVVSRPADGKKETRLSSEIGHDGHAFVEAATGGKLNADGSLAGRVALRWQHYDGDVPNPISGEREGGARLGALRTSLRYQPDATLKVDLSGGYTHDRRNNPAFILLQDPQFPRSGDDTQPLNRQKIGYATLKLDKELSRFRLTSTTGWQDVRLHNVGDFSDAFVFSASTGLPPAAFNNPGQGNRFDDREQILTQELRLNSLEGARVQWVAGVHYLRSEWRTDREANVGIISPTLNGRTDNRIDSQTLAGFADASVPLDDKFTLSGGLRLAHDRQKLSGHYLGNGTPGTVAQLDQRSRSSDSYQTGRLALSYAWNEQFMSYASVARGYASGGFEKTTAYAAFGLPAAQFQPAHSWTWELGSKARLANGLQASGTLFYNDVKDGQLVGFDPATFIPFITNQNFESYGIEGRLNATLARDLELTLAASATKTRLVDMTEQALLTGARDGNRVPQAPRVAGNIGLTWSPSAASLGLPGHLLLRGEYQFTGNRYSDSQNADRLPAYRIVNAELGWQYRDGVEFYLFGRNLNDERVLSYAVPFGPGATAVYISRGRMFGLGARLRW